MGVGELGRGAGGCLMIMRMMMRIISDRPNAIASRSRRGWGRRCGRNGRRDSVGVMRMRSRDQIQVWRCGIAWGGTSRLI